MDGKPRPGFALSNDTQRLFILMIKILIFVLYLLHSTSLFIGVSFETPQSTLTFKLKEKLRLFSLPLHNTHPKTRKKKLLRVGNNGFWKKSLA